MQPGPLDADDGAVAEQHGAVALVDVEGVEGGTERQEGGGAEAEAGDDAAGVHGSRSSEFYTVGAEGEGGVRGRAVAGRRPAPARRPRAPRLGRVQAASGRRSRMWARMICSAT